MRRALGALVAVGLFGCARTAAHPAATGATPDVCRAAPEPVVDPSLILPSVEPPWGARITRVEVEGAEHIPRELVLQKIRLRENGALESDAVAADVRAILELEAIDTVRVDADRLPAQNAVVLRYVLRERRVVGEVRYGWPDPLVAGHWVPLARGELYDPGRVARTRFDLERNLIEAGHLRAKVEAHQRATGRDRVDVCFAVEAGPKFLVDRIAFVGNDRVASGELIPLIQTHDGRANRPSQPYRDDLLDVDLARVLAHYYERGYLDATAGPARTTMADGGGGSGRITVEIPIHEGLMYRVRDVRFTGSPVKPEVVKEWERRLGVKAAEIFNRTKVVDGLEKIRELHRARGEVIELEPAMKLDPVRAEVDVVIDASISPAKPASSAK